MPLEGQCLASSIVSSAWIGSALVAFLYDLMLTLFRADMHFSMYLFMFTVKECKKSCFVRLKFVIHDSSRQDISCSEAHLTVIQGAFLLLSLILHLAR